MGRKARRRAEKREETKPHGIGPDEETGGGQQDRCPRCGSTHLVAMQRTLGMSPYAPPADVVCLNCGWQGTRST